MVSVIVPAYNAAATIRDTLDSLLAQTSPHWDAIVVDDGSQDGTGAIVEEYVQRDRRIRLVGQANGGESAARNTGVEHAGHEWLLFLDADDWIAATYIEQMTAALAADPALDAVCCRSVRVAADGTHVADPYQPPTGDLFATLAKRAAFPVHACVVRRALVDEVGRFDRSLVKSPDWDLWQRIARTGAKWGAVPDVLAFYRMQPQSASLAAEQMLRDGLTVMRRGHAPDPRVTRPHPDHAQGAPPAEMVSQQLYLLTWCAGLMIGQQRSALPLFDQIGHGGTELYANAVGQILFEAIPLPECRTRDRWESLWPGVRERVAEFLAALETRTKAGGLADAATLELKRLILAASPVWGPVIETLERTAARNLALVEGLDRDKVAFDQARAAQQLRAETAEIARDRLDEAVRRAQRVADDLQARLQDAEAHIALLESMRWLKLGRSTNILKVPPYVKKVDQL